MSRVPKCILMLLLAAACATNNGESEDTRAATAANEQSTYRVSTAPSDFQLAVEVEFSADGVTPVGSSVVNAPRKASSAIQDLAVRAKSQTRELSMYAIPDPRLAEIDDRERREHQILGTARAFVYAPLSAELTQIEIAPLPTAQQGVSRGGTLDARPLLRSACEKERELTVCQQILRASVQ